MSVLELVRPELRGFRGYSSARREAGRAGILLNANEASVAPATGSLALNRYPEPQPQGLRDALASLYGVPRETLLIGRGSDEGIDLLTRACCRAGEDAVLISPPTFGMYAICAEVQGARVVRVPLADATFAWSLDAVRAACDRTVKLVYVCSPNNPTGGLVPREAVLALADALAGRALVVVDEAYVEFADVASLAQEAATGRVAVLRTLSKAHALAGARIGVLIADRDLVALLERLMPPYPLATPSVAAAEAALAPAALDATRARVAATIAERDRLARALPAIDGVVEVLPSRANFLTVRFRDGAAAFARLAAAGIVVRDVSRYEGLANTLRISIGRREENDAVLAALAPGAAA